jgi:hypothetical protein
VRGALRRFLLPIALAVVSIISLASCSDAGTPSGGSRVTPRPAQIDVITLGETQPYRERLEDGLGSIAWTSPYSGPTPEAMAKGEGAVRDAISASAGRLAAVDYVALALPDWVTVTRQLTLTPGDFTGQGARASDAGSVDGRPRWLLYEWRGPEIPQRPDRPIVFRWLTVYGLYDITEERVTRLLATIRGEAHE